MDRYNLGTEAGDSRPLALHKNWLEATNDCSSPDLPVQLSKSTTQPTPLCCHTMGEVHTLIVFDHTWWSNKLPGSWRDSHCTVSRQTMHVLQVCHYWSNSWKHIELQWSPETKFQHIATASLSSTTGLCATVAVTVGTSSMFLYHSNGKIQVIQDLYKEADHTNMLQMLSDWSTACMSFDCHSLTIVSCLIIDQWS